MHGNLIDEETLVNFSKVVHGIMWQHPINICGCQEGKYIYVEQGIFFSLFEYPTQ